MVLPPIYFRLSAKTGEHREKIIFFILYSVTRKSTKKHKNRCVNIYFNKKT